MNQTEAQHIASDVGKYAYIERTQSVDRIAPLYSIATASESGIFVKLGRRLARRQGYIPSWFMTCVERLCATWCVQESPIMWP